MTIDGIDKISTEAVDKQMMEITKEFKRMKLNLIGGFSTAIGNRDELRKKAYVKAMGLLGLEPELAMMVAAHKGDLAAAQKTGMHTAYVQAPVADNVDAGFGKVGDSLKFDIDVTGFDALCQALGV